MIFRCNSLVFGLDSIESSQGVSQAQVIDQGSRFLIYVETQIKNCMCELSMKDFSIKIPATGSESGIISFNTYVKSNSYCAMAFGPHRGTFIFEKGLSLPQILNGTYILIIDEIAFGYLKISDDNAELIQSEIFEK